MIMAAENTTLSDIVQNTTVVEEEHGRDESLATMEVAILATIFTLALIGNSVVIICIRYMKRNKKRLGRMHWFIVHLSIADLFVAFGNVFPQMMWDITFRFQGGDFLCKIVKYFQLVAMFASSYMLVMTAIDRYVAICHPFVSQRWPKNIVHKLAAVAWAISFILSLPQLFIFSYMEVKENTNVYDCWGVFEPEWTLDAYITWTSISIYILPTIVLVAAYSRICVSVWKSEKIAERLSAVRKPRIPTLSQNCDSYEVKRQGIKLKSNEPEMGLNVHNDQSRREQNSVLGFRSRISNYFKSRQFRSSGISRGKMRTIKLSLSVTLCYFICWSPFFIAQLWAVFDSDAPFHGTAYTIILLLASLNSCTNPWIYLMFSDSVNENIRIIVCCLLCRPGAERRYQEKIRQTDVTSTTQVTSLQ